ncbi:hypothetical protein N7494_012591 [Penicillium frequentans]|uniref:Uncharacterized protein n=1 Tax=Penicillium frequentans TaxID=3151616 RepID=A0AAD6CM00_9EURO|nr:hypothetical protein N7494_012591 [Penicillium glabrum]
MDWEKWAEKECLDQSENLPNCRDVDLGNLPFLSEGDNFYEWLQVVTDILDFQGLTGLISETRPRPLFSNEKSKNWADLSQAVSIWMQDAILDDAIRLEIADGNESIDFADGFVKNAKKVLRPPQSRADVKKIKNLIKLKPSSFDTSLEYVLAYAEHFSVASEHGIAMAPYAALLTVLVNIKLSGRASDRFIYYQIHGMLQVDSCDNQDLSEWVTLRLFHYYMNQIIKLLMDDHDERLGETFGRI